MGERNCSGFSLIVQIDYGKKPMQLSQCSKIPMQANFDITAASMMYLPACIHNSYQYDLLHAKHLIFAHFFPFLSISSIFSSSV
jgi:hypothetical protein